MFEPAIDTTLLDLEMMQYIKVFYQFENKFWGDEEFILTMNQDPSKVSLHFPVFFFRIMYVSMNELYSTYSLTSNFREGIVNIGKIWPQLERMATLKLGPKGQPVISFPNQIFFFVQSLQRNILIW